MYTHKRQNKSKKYKYKQQKKINNTYTFPSSSNFPSRPIYSQHSLTRLSYPSPTLHNTYCLCRSCSIFHLHHRLSGPRSRHACASSDDSNPVGALRGLLLCGMWMWRWMSFFWSLRWRWLCEVWMWMWMWMWVWMWM